LTDAFPSNAFFICNLLVGQPVTVELVKAQEPITAALGAFPLHVEHDFDLGAPRAYRRRHIVSTSSCVKPSSANIQAGTLDRNASSLQRSQKSVGGALGALASQQTLKVMVGVASFGYPDVNTRFYL
jgi:hypothetical protein